MINNSQFKIAKLLLELGANPNKHDLYRGESATMRASGLYNKDLIFLKLLLDYGGNPNDMEDGPESTYFTTLIDATNYGNIEKVKLLVKAGANINFVNKFNNSAVSSALTQDKMDILLFLLENNADYTLNFSFGGSDPSGIARHDTMNICERLRQNVYNFNSKQYKQKMLAVDFLKKHGINYFNTPIPAYILNLIKNNYPDDWQNYIEKY